MQQVVKCYKCGKTFVLNWIRYQIAKTVTCIHCGKRIIRAKAEEK